MALAIDVHFTLFEYVKIPKIHLYTTHIVQMGRQEKTKTNHQVSMVAIPI